MSILIARADMRTWYGLHVGLANRAPSKAPYLRLTCIMQHPLLALVTRLPMLLLANWLLGPKTCPSTGGVKCHP